MSDSGVQRSRGFLVLVLGMSVLLVVGLGLYFLDWSRSSLPGKDLSYLHPSAVPRHLEALRSSDASTRKKAAHILWQMGDEAKEATPALLQAARDADPEVRAAAVQALGRTGQESQDAIAGLIKALQDDRAEVRLAAATSLAETWRIAGKGRSRAGRPPAGPRMAGPSDSPSTPPANKLTAAYEPLARKAVPLLTAGLRDADARIRAHDAEALAETGPLAEPAVPDLMHILQKDTDSEARLQATRALANVGPAARAAVPVLVDKLRHEKDDGVRVNTAFALGLIHSSPETVVPALVATFLTDEHPDARRCAVASIGMFGPEARIAIPLLREAAKDPKNQQSPEKMRRIDGLLSHVERLTQASRKDGPGKVSPASPGPPTKK